MARDRVACVRPLTCAQTADLFDVKTVARWAKAGKLPAQRTVGGHFSFDAREMRRILAATKTETIQDAPS
jgi:predicted site-specific integrase-resolvase